MAFVDYFKTLFGGKNFIRWWFGTIWSAFAMAYLLYVTTHDLAQGQKDIANLVIGALMGTIIASVFNFYFGSSQSSADKDEVIKRAAETKPV